MTESTENPSYLAAWYSASRPRTLTATYVPLGLAAAVAVQQGVFNLPRFVLALIGALALQIASNLINEYADYRKGADELKVAGQGMTIKNRVLSPNAVFGGAIVSVAIGVVIGLFLVTQTGTLLLWIGLFGVLVVITYTAGPFPLAYNGLGEIAVAICFGPLMILGAYYVMAAQTDIQPLIVSIPIAFTVAAILHANNIRDLDADRAVNKKTLAVRFGLQAARWEYAFLMYGAYVALVILVFVGAMPVTTLLSFITLPEARRLVHIIKTSADTSLLHMAQGRTARLHGQFGLLIVAGWLLFLVLQAVVT